MMQPNRRRESILAKDDDPAKSAIYQRITEDLHSTILRLQSRSTKLYVAIVIAIIFGVALTIFAGFFSSFDTAPLWWRLDAERHRVYSNVPTLAANSDSADREKYDFFKKATEHYWRNYDTLLQDSINDLSGKSNWVSVSLKVSIAGLIIFLVQILRQLYRWKSLPIVFYNARRYALLMSKGDLSATERWESVFAPATLDFGRDPRHPFQFFATLFSTKTATPAGAEKAHEGVSLHGRDAARPGEPTANRNQAAGE
jgi:hypothetical protein